jgi:hypothetical protein
VRIAKSSQPLPHKARGPSRLAAALLLGAALAGCGSANSRSSIRSSEVLVHIGSTAIDRAEVEHWASAIRRGNSVGTALGKTSGTPRERALEFLISSSWITGEAVEQGLSISNAAVERGLQAQTDAAPNGRSEFEEELTSTGQTLADVKLEVKAKLAAAKVRNAIEKRVPPLTTAEVGSYYTHHRQSFYLPDQRVVYLIEGIHEHARAVALARQVRPGAELTKPWFREVVYRTPEVADPGKLAHMVFAATPGRVSGPTKFFGDWVLAVVKKLIPAGIQPLTAVREALSKSLAVGRRERALKRFAAAYVRKWTARTSCSAGYVVQKCSEYRGTPAAEETPLTTG